MDEPRPKVDTRAPQEREDTSVKGIGAGEGCAEINVVLVMSTHCRLGGEPSVDIDGQKARPAIGTPSRRQAIRICIEVGIPAEELGHGDVVTEVRAGTGEGTSQRRGLASR